MNEVEEIRVKVPWGTLAAKVWGPPHGIPVLALHGWLDNAATFDRLVPLLPQTLRVVAIDFAGHGLSDHRPPGTTYHFIDGVTDVSFVMDELGWDRCRLLGHSLGGAVAAMLAGTYPRRVEKVALIEALGPMTAEADVLPERVETFLGEFKRLLGKRTPRYDNVGQAISARLKVGGISHVAAETLVTRGTRSVDDGVTWRTDPRLRLPSPLRLTESQVEAFLRRVECPALLVQATDGLRMDPAAFDRRCQAIRRLEIATFPGGHHLHLDTPEVVAPTLSQFLSE